METHRDAVSANEVVEMFQMAGMVRIVGGAAVGTPAVGLLPLTQLQSRDPR